MCQVNYHRNQNKLTRCRRRISVTLATFLAALCVRLQPSGAFSTYFHRHGPNVKQRMATNIQAVSGDIAAEQVYPVAPSEAPVASGVSLTPYQILHPAAFSSPNMTGSRQALPFRACLQLLQQTLDCILRDEFLPEAAANSTVVRLEHTLSHEVDPLGWLHAQSRRNPQETTIYFANAEKSMEAAVIGSVYTHSDALDETFWNFCSNLPDHSRVFGGERFDQETTPAEEWKAFGKGFWILPAVELRKISGRTALDNIDSDETSFVPSATSLAVHLCRDSTSVSWMEAAQHALKVLSRLTNAISEAVPPTTLPPIMSREASYGPDLDAQEIYERGVASALAEFQEGSLQKVVLARRMDLKFHPSARFGALDILRKWKYGGHEGGHLFYMSPGVLEDDLVKREFFGCSPERLFQVHNGQVLSEALAGTRPRGSTPEADASLCQDLFQSEKDRQENLITGRIIRKTFRELCRRDWITSDESSFSDDANGRFFVRRLRHLQHICERFEGKLQPSSNAVHISRFLHSELHPTPAVCGFPGIEALNFIQKSETVAFDRGFYAGPFGCYGRASADIIVAIRSGLVTGALPTKQGRCLTSLSVFAGAGIVPGSSVQGEWTETSYKLQVISSLFPSSPLALQSASTPNVAWANAFIEELVRCGVTQFYVCPGSRSTPLVAALARAMRSNVGVVHAQCIHDERSAAFRALGYGRGVGRPAAVITSSGTAVSNLYPAVVEAGMDGVPLLLLTADRPYESRATGANQAIDQVKVFSSTYIRWFRDIPPPSDDVPVSLALSDASHAVSLSRQLRGPVHLNIQFRENLAPEGGSIRNDNRVDSVTRFNGFRFTDIPGFQRWSAGGGRWIRDLSGRNSIGHATSPFGMTGAVEEIADLIMSSRRGIIVVGNVRTSTDEREAHTESQVSETISNFAQAVGFPVIAGVQSGSLRSRSPAVIPYAEHVLKHPLVGPNVRPDLVIQIGTPLISTEIQNVIEAAMREREESSTTSYGIANHVLIHPHGPEERADPFFTVSHRVSVEVSPFLDALMDHLKVVSPRDAVICSELAPLVLLGRELRKEMPKLINYASRTTLENMASKTGNAEESHLTEPQVVLAMHQVMSNLGYPLSLFLSNSMPVRDAEFFLYPDEVVSYETSEQIHVGLGDVGVNRGASGIDGIISTAAGFADSTGVPTTLVIGDLAALHDINALHMLSGKHPQQGSANIPRLTSVVVNNDGGGIFSFLPVAKHGSDVNFEEFWGTPTNEFSFQDGVGAFGLEFQQSTSFASFVVAYEEALRSKLPSIIEAKVVGREANVAVHREITKLTTSFLDGILATEGLPPTTGLPLPIKRYRSDLPRVKGRKDDRPEEKQQKQKTLLLLHGWMGDKSEWDAVGDKLMQSLSPEWDVVAIDLPGHGESPLHVSSPAQSIHKSLGLSLNDATEDEMEPIHLSINEIARNVVRSLKDDYGINFVDAVAGYSLGGRVALAMMRLCQESSVSIPSIVDSERTKVILLSSYPGDVPSALGDHTVSGTEALSGTASLRTTKDKALSEDIVTRFNRAYLLGDSVSNRAVWSAFLKRWYAASIWGELQTSEDYPSMLSRRLDTLSKRGKDLAAVLRLCSPGRHTTADWRAVRTENTLFLSGALDAKYSAIGRTWNTFDPKLHFIEVPEVGHALLVERPSELGSVITSFLRRTSTVLTTKVLAKSDESDRLSPSGARRERSTDRVFRTAIWNQLSIGSLDFEPFSLNMVNKESPGKGVVGIGWGDRAKPVGSDATKRRSGLILQIVSSDGSVVGIGEVSPLTGVHPESMHEAWRELEAIQEHMRGIETLFLPTFDAVKVLALNGALGEYIDSFLDVLGRTSVTRSVHAGLEMAFLSVAAQNVGMPLLQALLEFGSHGVSSSMISASSNTLLPLNGLVMRDGSGSETLSAPAAQVYPSLKVKVGHQNPRDDESLFLRALESTRNGGKIRADANQAWDREAASRFVEWLENQDEDALERIEFIEEPLLKVPGGWTLEGQVEALERWHEDTNISYALDESVGDLSKNCQYDFALISEALRETFSSGPRGCAALVLKPSLLGLELSMRLARLAHKDLGVGAVFSSSFDSGVGLGYAAFVAAAADKSIQDTPKFAHGLGTFQMTEDDTLSPSFSSYVTNHGYLKVSSLSRAFLGLGLDEMRDSFVTELPINAELEAAGSNVLNYGTAAATSSSGREVSVVVSLSLPFAADAASSRFTDLPQQPRWSPWLSSVAYLDAGRETEWRLNVRGVRFSWRAVSTLLEKPYPGIAWESVSGLKNKGVVEFIPTAIDECMMKVRMTIITPRVVSSLFPGASAFAEDFLQNKLLKWSLEAFRDVVKGDLAFERGDIELGDALFGAAEARKQVVEETLSNPSISGGPLSDGSESDP